MKATEFRIGNLVDLYGSIATVQRFDFNDRPPNGLAVDKGKPIPITPELLERAGFEKTFKEWKPKELDDIIDFPVCLIQDEDSWGIYSNSDGDYLCKIKYIHQLQNLYFALTQKELEIK